MVAEVGGVGMSHLPLQWSCGVIFVGLTSLSQCPRGWSVGMSLHIKSACCLEAYTCICPDRYLHAHIQSEAKGVRGVKGA